MNPPVPFQLEEEHVERGIVLRPIGELDVSSAPAVRDRLIECLRSAAGRLLVFDCEQLGFLDSSGLSLLTYAKVRMDETGGTLRLARVDPRVERVIELAGLSELLARFDTVEQALTPPEGTASA